MAMRRVSAVLLLFMALDASGEVNVNTASKSQLEGITGIDPISAKAIIDYRDKNGPFMTFQDLEKVPGISNTTMKKIRSTVSIKDPVGRVEKMPDPCKLLEKPPHCQN